MVNKCYDGAFMCDKWRDDPESFEEWYSMNYYECDGERMAVDKDLLYRGKGNIHQKNAVFFQKQLIQL